MAKNSKAETKIDAPVEVRTVSVDAEGNKKYRCQYCGKWIKAASWEEFLAGDYCHQLRDERGFTDATLQAHRREMSADNVPVTEDGREYIKVAVLDRKLKKLGIPISRMVRAFGKDRTIDGAMHEKWTPVYVGRARYLHPDCGEQWGLDFLTSMGRAENGKPTEQAVIEAALS